MRLILVLFISSLTIVAVYGQSYSPKHTVIKNYHLITLSPVNWYKAFHHCRSLGMHLVSISSQEENNLIKKQIRDEGHEDKLFWTSGINLGFDSYQWMGNGKSVKYTDWASGEPSNSNNNEHCLLIWKVVQDGDLKWNDGTCDSNLNFICEEDRIEYEYCAN